MTEKPPPISGLVKKPEWLLGAGFFVKWLLDYEPEEQLMNKNP
jgi:hypothetical protein